MPATEAPLDDLDSYFHRVAVILEEHKLCPIPSTMIPILNRVGTNRLELPLRAGQLTHVLAHICC